MVDYEMQRRNMVESQVRPSDVTDRRIMRAMLEIQRELFVPAAASSLAYMDQDVALMPAEAGGIRRALLAPRTMAKLIQMLELGDDDTVLEVGCGTGYGAAVLSRVARSVVALECDPTLAARARSALAAAGAGQVEVITGVLGEGVPARAPFAAILVSGALPRTPPALLDQLIDGGRLAVVETESGVGRLVQWRRDGGTFGARAVTEASAPELPGFARDKGFVF